MKTIRCSKIILFSTLFLWPIASFSQVNTEANIQDLQQRANFAYEQMMKAKYKAELSAMEVTDAEKALARARKSLERAEQEAESARRKSEQAKQALEQAQQRWNQASDTLAHEWKKSEQN